MMQDSHDTITDKKNSQTWLKTTLGAILLMSAGCAMSFSVWAVDLNVIDVRNSQVLDH